MKKLEKYAFAFMVAVFIFVLGAVIGNGYSLQGHTLKVSQPSIPTRIAVCAVEKCPKLTAEDSLIVLHNSGVAVFDLATIQQLESKGKIKKEQYVADNKTRQTGFVQVVDSTLFRQQLEISMHSDTVFVSPEYSTINNLDWIIERKNNSLTLSDKKTFVDEFGTIYPSKQAWLQIALVSQSEPAVDQRQHFFYHDTTGVGVYGQILADGDTVILRIDSNKVATNDDIAQDTQQVALADSSVAVESDTVSVAQTQDSIAVDETNSRYHQFDTHNEVTDTNQNVSSDNHTNEEYDGRYEKRNDGKYHQKVQRYAKDNQIVKHHKPVKVKKNKSEKKKHSKHRFEFIY